MSRERSEIGDRRTEVEGMERHRAEEMKVGIRKMGKVRSREKSEVGNRRLEGREAAGRWGIGKMGNWEVWVGIKSEPM